MYCRHRWDKLSEQVFTRYYLKNRKHFLQLLLHVRNLHKILLIFNKKISFIALIFRKLLNPTNVVTLMPVSSSFRTPFASKRVHGSQTLLEFALQHFHPNFPLIKDNLSWKTSLLARSEILGLFGNTLTADHMSSRHRWDKLMQQVQMLLSQKQKIFSEIFIEFLESTQNFAHFQRNDQLYPLNISEVIENDKCGYFNARKLFFKNTVSQ